MIDIATEDIFPFSQAHAKLNLSPQTLRNYADKGVINVTSGERVYLETVQLPSGKATSVEAYHRFVKNINGVGDT